MTDPGFRPARFFLSLAFVVLAAAGSGSASIAAQDDAAVRVLRESIDRYKSDSMEYAGDLVTTTPAGAERRKTWRSYRSGQGAVAQRLIIFLSPAEVRGVAFLSRGRQSQPANQWIYLPSMKRERRLAEPDRDTRFAGTDFTFEDLEEIDPSRFRVSSLPDDMVDGQPAYRLSLVALRRSAYQSEVLTIRKSDLVLLKREGRRHGEASPSKRLTLSEYGNAGGRLVAMRVEMADLKRGSRTAIRLSEVYFDRPQPADRFTVQNLSRAVVR